MSSILCFEDTNHRDLYYSVYGQRPLNVSHPAYHVLPAGSCIIYTALATVEFPWKHFNVYDLFPFTRRGNCIFFYLFIFSTPGTNCSCLNNQPPAQCWSSPFFFSPQLCTGVNWGHGQSFGWFSLGAWDFVAHSYWAKSIMCHGKLIRLWNPADRIRMGLVVVMLVPHIAVVLVLSCYFVYITNHYECGAHLLNVNWWLWHITREKKFLWNFILYWNSKDPQCNDLIKLEQEIPANSLMVCLD